MENIKELEEYRKLTDNELTYIKFKNMVNNFFQIVIECEKDGVNVNKVNEALDKICDVSKYFNLVIKKKSFYFSKRKFKLNIIDEIVEIDGKNLNDFEFFNSKLGDNLFEVYFFKTIEHDYLVFKFNHSFVDGKGALYIIKTLIAILNNEKVEDNFEFEADIDYIAKKETVKFKENLKYSNKITKIGDNSKNHEKIIRRLKVNSHTNAVIPKIISVINKYYLNENIIYIIPTDIRNQEREKNISNLTLPLYLHVQKDDNWEEIYLKFYNSLKEKKNLNISNLKYGLLLKPSNKIFELMIKSSEAIQDCTNCYFTGGSITNLGIIDSKSYKCEDIKINSMFNIPFYQPLLPFVITVIENASGVDIIFTTNSKIISEENVNLILKEISEVLEK